MLVVCRDIFLSEKCSAAEKRSENTDIRDPVKNFGKVLPAINTIISS